MERNCRSESAAATLALAFAFAALAAGTAAAQTPEPATPSPVPQRAVPTATGPLAAPSEAPGRLYAFAGFAAFGPEKNSSLQNERGSLLNFIGGAGYRLWPDWSVELNVLFDNRRLDTPPSALPTGPFQPGTAKSFMFTTGVAATAKYSFGHGRLEPYAGGGMGVYRTRFLTTSEAPACSNNCSDTGPRVTGRSTDLGYHAMAGATFAITPRDRVSAELRYLKLDADFGAILPAKVSAGGAFLWVGFQHAFF